MWHFINNDFEVHGTRQELKEQLNIFMVGFEDKNGEYYEELADIWDNKHWEQICRTYGIYGED